MKTNPILIAASLALALANASCTKSSQDSGNDKGAAPAAQQNAPSSKSDAESRPAERKQGNIDFVDDAYRATVSKWGKSALFVGMHDSEAFARAKSIDMHYAYLAFVELFPDSSNRTECLAAMKQFSCADTPTTKTTLSFAELTTTFGFNGEKRVYRWNDGLAYVKTPNGSIYVVGESFNSRDSAIPVAGNSGSLEAPKGVCFGNLQLQNSGFEVVQDGLALDGSTRIIFKRPTGK